MSYPLNEFLSSKLPPCFDENGKFRILMISDVHGGRGYAKAETVRALTALLDAHSPDLVLLGGDIAGPGKIHVETEEDLRDLLSSLCAPMEERGIPWAQVFGNHDDNFGLSCRDQQAIYESYPHCLSKAGDESLSGVGNYLIPILDKRGGRPRFLVWGMDSHRSFDDYLTLPEGASLKSPLYPIEGEGGIQIDQVRWYYDTSLALEEAYGEKIPGMIFCHIPLPEHALAAACKGSPLFTGSIGETVSVSALNSGLFAACVKRGDVRAIFCGHDHENDFCMPYGGILLGCDGFLSYHACHNAALRGGRLIELSLSSPPFLTTKMVRVPYEGCEDGKTNEIF